MAIEDEVRRLVDTRMNELIAPLKDAMNRLADAAVAFNSATGGGAARRGPGRPRGTGARRGPGRPPKSSSDVRGCAIAGCRRPARSKGYCSTHYQKRRRLEASGRLPTDWKDDAPAGSVNDLKLPRGRAAHKKR